MNEKEKLQKAALGIVDSYDDDDVEQDIDLQIEQLFAIKRIVKAPVITTTTLHIPQATATDKLDLAKRLAARISNEKNLGAEAKIVTQQAAESVFKNNLSQPMITAKTVTEQMAAKLHTKFNYQPKEDDESLTLASDAMFKKFEEELWRSTIFRSRHAGRSRRRKPSPKSANTRRRA